MIAILEQGLPVPPERVFPMKPKSLPPYPFVRYMPVEVQPWEIMCDTGVQVNLGIHVFSREEDEVQSLAAAVVAALDGSDEFSISDWIRTQFLQDTAEADVWHAVVQFNIAYAGE